MARLRLAFFGTPAFAVPSLEALSRAGHDVARVYSQPPRASGRGKRVRPGPVHEAALAQGIPVRTPAKLKDGEETRFFAALAPDAAVVVAYGLLLPRTFLAVPRLGAVNVHPSLLPRWRGAAPIERAILAGDAVTGVTIMRMDEGLDTGPVLLQERVPIGSGETAGSLGDSLARLGASLLVQALDGLARGTLAAVAQDESRATLAPKLTDSEERLDWSRPADELERRVRALAPRPGAWFVHAGERVRVLAAEAVSDARAAPPGTVLDDGLAVSCGRGAIRLTVVQRQGRGTMPAVTMLRGHPIPAGTVLGRGEAG